MKVKAILAGVLALAASGVNAAPIEAGDSLTGAPGDVFLALLDTTPGANFGYTYVLNLTGAGHVGNFETVLANIKNGQNADINLGADPNWANFAGHSVTYNIVSGNVNRSAANTDKWGLLVTGSAGTNTNIAIGGDPTDASWEASDTSLAVTISGNIRSYVLNFNVLLPGTTNSTVVAPNTPGRSWDVAFGSLIANSSPVLIGTAVNNGDLGGFFHLGNDRTLAGIDGYAVKLGDWQLTTNNHLVFTSAFASQVPVPAAIWLLGSSLLGMVTVARRNRQA